MKVAWFAFLMTLMVVNVYFASTTGTALNSFASGVLFISLTTLYGIQS